MGQILHEDLETYDNMAEEDRDPEEDNHEDLHPGPVGHVDGGKVGSYEDVHDEVLVEGH